MAESSINKNDVQPGKLAAFQIAGNRVAVANVGGTFYAFDDICTHRQCSLAGGTLNGKTVTCPCHGSQFEVTTGGVLHPPAVQPVKVYRVRVEGDTLTVEA
jgi:3-phenylpropionate/trans-cinnamate dioxygenase ferredoxin component